VKVIVVDVAKGLETRRNIVVPEAWVALCGTLKRVPFPTVAVPLASMISQLRVTAGVELVAVMSFTAMLPPDDVSWKRICPPVFVVELPGIVMVSVATGGAARAVPLVSPITNGVTRANKMERKSAPWR
jgi:hypothetical protein